MRYVSPIGTPIWRAGGTSTELFEVARSALKSMGTSGSVVVVTSPSVAAKMEVFDPIIDASTAYSGYTPLIFSTVRRGALRADIDAVVELLLQNDAAHLISLGGASSVDTGKAAVAALLQHHKDSSADLPAKVSHIAIPSTLGGAEFTSFAGVTEPEGKRAVTDARIAPDAVVHATGLLASLPTKQLRHTIANAISHSLEGLRSPQATPVTIALQLWGLRGLATAALTEGGAEHSNFRRLQDAAAATVMVPVSMGPAHAAVHALTAVREISHGIAHGILGVAALRMIEQQPRSADNPLSDDLLAMLPGTGAASHRLANVNSHLGIPATLSQAGVSDEEIVLAQKELGKGPDQPDPARVATATELLDAAW